MFGNKSDTVNLRYGFQNVPSKDSLYKGQIDILVNQFVCRDDTSILYKGDMVENLDLSIPGDMAYREPLIESTPKLLLKHTRMIKKMT